MSELENLTTEIRRATDYQINKQILREKIQTDLHVPFNGGLFLVTQELISFLTVMQDEILYLEDTYHNPIEVDRVGLLIVAREHYQKVMNRWHQEHNELKRLRKI
ncbi:hypothetical protein UFOVP112_112 [uncultured Caudovirales phage]|uniref:Uncharacterized protein n=1 Tax=uncultured Caudovirales phage TaxID=2100421 RepID=A0A6J5L2I6_9CAUD|nr:hypothetical protein UFOVP112_112 [uncultured Caudovirales phage]